MVFNAEGRQLQICEILALSPRPLKARELAKLLDFNSSRALNKRDVNHLLYELKKYGIASQDLQYRWSVCPLAIQPDGGTNRFVATVDPEEKRRIRELGPRPVSALIGHWVFTLGREPATSREVWRIECTLCGFQTGCRVQNRQQVYPLAGNLRDRRRRHDRSTHPDKAKEQVVVEKQSLGQELLSRGKRQTFAWSESHEI